jgi:hypothetical protein
LFDHFQAVEAASHMEEDHTEVAHLMAVEAQDGPSQFLQDGAQVAQEAMDQEVATDQVAMVSLPHFSNRSHQ